MSDDFSSPKRPLLITIFAILELLGAIVCLASGILALVGGTAVSMSGTEDAALLATAGAVGGAVFIVLGIIMLILSIGMFKGWRVIWYLEVIFGILGILVNAASLILTAFNFGTLIALIIIVALVYYMFRPNVKAFFRI